MINTASIKKALLNLNALLRIKSKRRVNFEESTISGIVFSMNRPIQLFALLESYYK